MKFPQFILVISITIYSFLLVSYTSFQNDHIYLKDNFEKWHEMINIHRQALQDFRKDQDYLTNRVAIGKTHNNIAQNFLRLRKQNRSKYLDSARFHAFRATIMLKYDKSAVNEYLSALRRCGKIEWYSGNFQKAMNYFDKILIIAEQENNVDQVFQNYQAAIIYKAKILSNLGQYDEAIEIHQKLHDFIDSNNVSQNLIFPPIYHELSIIYEKKNEHSKALDYAQKALWLNKKKGSPLVTAHIYINLANIAVSNKEYAAAQEYLCLVEEFYKDGTGPIALFYYYQSKAILAAATRNFQSQLEYAYKANDLLKYLHFEVDQLKIKQLLSNAYIQIKDFEKAFLLIEEIRIIGYDKEISEQIVNNLQVKIPSRFIKHNLYKFQSYILNKKNLKQQILSMVVGVVLALFFSFYYFRSSALHRSVSNHIIKNNNDNKVSNVKETQFVEKTNIEEIVKDDLNDGDNYISSFNEVSVLLFRINDEAIFQHFNYKLYKVMEVEESLLVLEQKNIDLIVFDPLFNAGNKLFKKLQEKPELRGVSILCLLPYATYKRRLRHMVWGLHDYIIQPFSVEQLFKCIERLIKLRSQRNLYLLQESPEVSEMFLNRISNGELQWIKNIQKKIRENLEIKDFKLHHLYEELGMSAKQFRRKIKHITGMTPKKFENEIALQKARKLLLNQTYHNASAVASSTGFSNVTRFNKLYEERFGEKPAVYF